jgi:hypothetical protein
MTDSGQPLKPGSVMSRLVHRGESLGVSDYTGCDYIEDVTISETVFLDC